MSKVTIDASFLKPFIEGTKNTLKVQGGVDTVIGAPFLKGKGPTLNAEVAAVVGITSENFRGTMVLLFTGPLYLKIMSNMIGEPLNAITPENEDGAGELLNIIFGWAKKVLNPQGHTIQKAIPTVLRGENIKGRHVTSAPVYVLPFKSEFGELHVEICIQTTNKL